ncbi:MAG: cobalt transporter CbiM [Desulfobacterales bacterium]|jgi:cobalt/nickel transport system permease protein
MHISEGVLSGSVLISGAALAAAGTGIGLKKLDYDQIAKAGMLSAAFFVASLIHVPIGPSNAHLILNGLVGILLGWAAFPAILVALILHGVFFQFGGITSLGVNTIIMALPAVFCYLVFGKLIHKSSRTAAAAAFACGFLSVLISGVIVGLSLIFTEENFLKVSGIIIAAHIPVMLIEGIITAACVAFLRKVRPEMLPGYHG